VADVCLDMNNFPVALLERNTGCGHAIPATTVPLVLRLTHPAPYHGCPLHHLQHILPINLLCWHSACSPILPASLLILWWFGIPQFPSEVPAHLRGRARTAR
jgi:hypothetical protein